MNSIKYYLIIVTLLIVSCSKSESNEGPPGENSYIPSQFEDGVSKWTTEDFIFDKYYTKINDFHNALTHTPSVSLLYADGVITDVKWEYNGTSIANKEKTNIWVSKEQQWLSGNVPVFEENKLFAFGDKFKVTVQFTPGKMVVRECTIAENKIVTDVLGVNFGMTQEQVRRVEERRLKMIGREISPSRYVINAASSMGSMTVYSFENKLLVEVGEYTKIRENNNIDNLNTYSQRIGLTETIELNGDKTLKKDYEWQNQKIAFKIVRRDDLGYNPTTLESLIGVTYRLIK